MSQHQPKNKHILITGGTGLLGRLITSELLNRGYQVSHLSRSPGKNPAVKTYLWNISENEIDEQCLEGVDTILHLAGAGIADKRWTNKRKREIIDSRTKSIALIYRLMKSKPNGITTIVSASGTSYYGDGGDALLTEESKPTDDFLSACCIAWENAVDEGRSLGLRIVKFRTGVVLDKRGGALPQMANPVKLALGAAFGNGRQWLSWIHWQDTVSMYLYGIENSHISGVYNMVAPHPVNNKQFMKALARQLHRPLWPVNVPRFVFKLLLGEMSAVVLDSTRASAEKISKDGFTFKYPELTDALKEIYG
jgi:uncharacterized protein (TIGR01777 family)